VLTHYFPHSSKEILRYAELLLTAGIERGLIGPREAPRIWGRHLFNSLLLTPYLPEGATVIDVGSGAGLPGIPLALARPDLKITLLEPLQRRVDFLEEVKSELGLTITIIRGRAEESKGSYQVVTARALSATEKLLPQVWHLLSPGGAVVALKGSSVEEEVRQAQKVISKLKPDTVAIEEPYLEGIESGKILIVRKGAK
jgi:16S rRNA (guanine527-N7)-methyltransferase